MSLFNDENDRADVHPLALLETEAENHITECLACGLPTPEEANGDVYCDKACENTHLDMALQESDAREVHEALTVREPACASAYLTGNGIVRCKAIVGTVGVPDDVVELPRVFCSCCNPMA